MKIISQELTRTIRYFSGLRGRWTAVAEIARACGYSRSTATRHARYLVEIGICERSNTRPPHYRMLDEPTQRGRKAIADIEAATHVFRRDENDEPRFAIGQISITDF